MILVVAGDLRQYEYWCREHEIPFRDRSVVKYVQEVRDLQGYGTPTIVFVGTWRYTWRYNYNEYFYLKSKGCKMFVADRADPPW